MASSIFSPVWPDFSVTISSTVWPSAFFVASSASRSAASFFNGNLQHGLGRSRVLGVLSHEIRLASQAEKVGLLAHDLRHDHTLRSGTVGTLRNDELTLLADNVLSRA